MYDPIVFVQERDEGKLLVECVRLAGGRFGERAGNFVPIFDAEVDPGAEWTDSIYLPASMPLETAARPAVR